MTIVVTGAGGFVGRQLVERLLDKGADVVALDTNVDALPASHPRLRAMPGNLADPPLRAEALSTGCSVVVHLATVPGGAAEADPVASRRINLDVMYDLLLEASERGSSPRFVYASSIAVLGDPLPPGGVDDTTAISPKMIYGGHKAMMEIALAMMSNRGMVDGVTVRLPAILARPPGLSGMKSAFMSDIFHALRVGRSFTCPVSADATIWAQSVDRCVDNFVHATDLNSGLMPRGRAVTLPAIRMTMGDLAEEIARQCRVSASLVTYQPDDALEAAFGALPPLETPAAEAAGFSNDGSLEELVRRALARIAADAA